MTTQAAAIVIVTAVSEAIKEAGKIPAGELYAALMPFCTLNQFETLIDTMKRANLVKEENHLLTWIGVS
jgi:hypothetical protein